MKVYLDSIGCRLNQAEIEKFASQFHALGHQIVASPAQAELAIINTCTVTTEAASDSRQKIRQAGKAGCPRIIPVGCLSTLEKESLENLQGVEMVISNDDKDQLLSLALGQFPSEDHFHYREPVQGSRKRIRAFIKAQDGCDQHCTYCVTRFARGKSRSVQVEEVTADIRAAENAGAQEAVLSGVQLGGWGRDLSPPKSIVDLVTSVLAQTSIPRLRLSSIEPWGLPETFYSLWENPRLCQQLHLPLQSGSVATLKHMGRENTPDSYREIVAKIRRFVPEIAVTTDIIVGFPGETGDEFLESVQFVEAMGFAGGHVFSYSGRTGTPSELLPDKVDPKVKKERSQKMRDVLERAKNTYQRDSLGKTVNVLWERSEKVNGEFWNLSGWSGNYLRVMARSPKNLENEISRVELVRCEPNGVYGIIV